MTYDSKDMNYWANEWRDIGGPNVIPMNGKIPNPKIGKHRNLLNKPIDQVLHNHWIKNDFFENGIGIVNGKCYHNKYKLGLWIHTIDVDTEVGRKIILNLFGVQNLEELSKKGAIVEWHKGNPIKFHVIIFAKGELPNLPPNPSGVEIKGNGKLTTVTPTMHEDGTIRQFVGDSLNSLASPIPIPRVNFIQKMGDALKPFGFDYLNGKAYTYSYNNKNNSNNNSAARILIETTDKVYKGGRNPNLYAYACSVLMKNWTRKPIGEIKQMVVDTNLTHCVPALELPEVEQIWNSAFRSVGKLIVKEDDSDSKTNSEGGAKDKAEIQRLESESDSDLLTEKVTEQDIKFVIDTMVKEAKHDKISIKQLLYGMASGFTMVVIHHIVNSKSAGAGKSYLLSLVSDYFPKRYVLVLIGASDKALQHKEGIMVLEDLETGNLTEIEPIINRLQSEKLNSKQEIESEKLKEKNKNQVLIKNLQKQIVEKEEEIKSILDRQQKLIILNDTIILLLDTPQDAFYEGLMSLLSNDTNRDQKYLFTDKSASGKLGSKYNILRGTPVMFTTRVIDDTRNERFEERNRRFINVTPNVSPQKIEDANALILKGAGLTPEEYDESVVSRKEKEKAERIVSVIVEKLRNHTKYLAPKQYGIKIPFIDAIKIPSNAEWSMTVMRRLVGYLSIITKFNMDSRPRLVRKDNPNIFLPVATFEDLRETLDLMERGGSNIRPYIAGWYNDVFLSAFNAENGNVKNKPIEGGEIQENYVSVTSTQLRDKTREVKKISISSDDLRHKFIDPLINQGLIEKARSEIRKSENIYFPVDETGENIFSLFSGDDLRLIVKDATLYPSKGLVVSAFSRHFGNQARIKCRDNKSGVFQENILGTYKLEDSDGSEITPEELADKYFTDAETCFIKDYQENDKWEV